MILIGPQQGAGVSPEAFVKNSDGIWVYPATFQRTHWADTIGTLSPTDGLFTVGATAGGATSITIDRNGQALTGTLLKSMMLKIGNNYYMVTSTATASNNQITVNVYPAVATDGIPDNTPVTICDPRLEVHDFTLGVNALVWQPGFRAYMLINPANCGYSGYPVGFFVKDQPASGVDGVDYVTMYFDGFYAGKYQASREDATSSAAGTGSIATSRQGVVPWASITYDDAVLACARTSATTGKDVPFRLINNRQWVALAVYSMLLGPAVFGPNRYGPFGNNSNTASPYDVDDSAVVFTADPTQVNRALTGTGTKAGWPTGQNLTAHNGKISGVYDLNGNVWEWVSGLKIKVGGTGGNSDAKFWVNDKDTGIAIPAGLTSGNRFLSLMPNAELRAHGIPAATDGTGNSQYGSDGFWFSTSANTEYVAIRGGCWVFGVQAGVWALDLSHLRSYSGTGLGFRLALSL
jgi:formylglycine-generating enzyme required for sulfatase activity